jgi:hypothetical protein
VHDGIAPRRDAPGISLEPASLARKSAHADSQDVRTVRAYGRRGDRGLLLAIRVIKKERFDVAADSRRPEPCAFCMATDAPSYRSRSSVCGLWRRLHRRGHPLVVAHRWDSAHGLGSHRRSDRLGGDVRHHVGTKTGLMPVRAVAACQHFIATAFAAGWMPADPTLMVRSGPSVKHATMLVLWDLQT